MNESSDWLDLDQITARLRVVTSEQLGLKLEQVKPETAFCRFLNSVDTQKHDIELLVALAPKDDRLR